MIKPCKICGNEFVVVRNVRTYCGEKCQKEGLRLRYKRSYLKRRGTRKNYHANYRITNPDKIKLYEEIKKHNKYIQGADGPSKRVYIKTCIETGVVFVAKSPDKKYATHEASLIAQSKERSERAKRTNKLILLKNCKDCGKEFKANKTVSCCKPCQKIRYERNEPNRKLQKYNKKQWRRSIYKKGDKIIPDKVYERFGYLCCHCGINTFNVIRGLNHPHEPTIDHVIPLSKGGTHTYHNVQLLCRQCNTHKRDIVDEKAALEFINANNKA
jgi:5-methylcytosine-specific restriction endonuclease McrA